jgi:hypothetical protein
VATAPAAIKNAFHRWVEGWGWATGERFVYPYTEMVFDVGRKHEELQVTALLGKLWHCTDRMPKDLCERLDMDEGSTYAQAAQKIMAAGRRGKFWIPRSGYRVPP